MNVLINRFASRILPDIRWHFPVDKKRIYLTFDDGPTEQFTSWILQTLDNFQAKATFFCLGKQVKSYPEQFRSIREMGHSIGSHGYSHLDGFFVPYKRYISDVHLADHLIQSSLFRPPYGRMKPFQYHHLKKRYQIVLWDILTRDYDQKRDPKKIISDIKRNARPGTILVFHDSEKAQRNLKKILPEILQYYKDEGYEFSAISVKTSTEYSI